MIRALYWCVGGEKCNRLPFWIYSVTRLMRRYYVHLKKHVATTFAARTNMYDARICAKKLNIKKKKKHVHLRNVSKLLLYAHTNPSHEPTWPVQADTVGARASTGLHRSLFCRGKRATRIPEHQPLSAGRYCGEPVGHKVELFYTASFRGTACRFAFHGWGDVRCGGGRGAGFAWVLGETKQAHRHARSRYAVRRSRRRVCSRACGRCGHRGVCVPEGHVQPFPVVSARGKDDGLHRWHEASGQKWHDSSVNSIAQHTVRYWRAGR